MKVKFKEDEDQLNDLQTGDTIKAKWVGHTYVFVIVEGLDENVQYALVQLNRGCSGMLTADGETYSGQDEFTETVPELIKNLKEQGFTDIEKAEFTLVED